VTKQTTPTTNIWGDRLLTILTILVGISFLAILVLGSYFDRPITQALSFDIEDGQCEPSTQGVGVHCFGDYQLPNIYLNEPNLWEEMQYSPTALIPHILANETSKIFGERTILVIYLALLACALMTPSFLVTRKSARNGRRYIPLLLIGVATIPFIFTVDRGNSVGFVVPLLVVFAFRLREKPDWTVTAAIIGAAAIRPQFALLAIGLIAFGQLRQFATTAVGSILINIAPFLLVRGNIKENISNWFANILDYQEYSSFNEIYPVKLSISQTLFNIFDFTNNQGGKEFVEQQTSLISIAALLTICVLVFTIRKKMSPPLAIVISLISPTLLTSSSFGYYSIFVLVIAARVCLFDDFNKHSTPWMWTLVGSTALTLAPLPFVIETGRNSIVLEQFGLIWTVVLIATLFQLPKGATKEVHS
jgi:hypothetical protein